MQSLSTTDDGSQSNWLSTTNIVSEFALSETTSGAGIETWNDQGLHVSMSPFVAVGAAGTCSISDVSGDMGCEVQTTTKLALPDQTLPPVPFGGDGVDAGGHTGGSNNAEQLAESAMFGFNPLLYGRASIADRPGRHTLGPFADSAASQSSPGSDRVFWIDASTQHAVKDLKGRDGSDPQEQDYMGYELWRDARFQVGLAGRFETEKCDLFNNVISANFESYFIGPHVGWQPDDGTLINLWNGYASGDYCANIGPPETSFESDRFFFDTNATRRFKSGVFSIFQRIGVFYAMTIFRSTVTAMAQRPSAYPGKTLRP